MGLGRRLGILAQRLGDIRSAGPGPLDPALWRAELSCNHRVRERDHVAKLLPRGAVGAELGVFTGLFSARLLEIARPREIYFVDVWWQHFGEHYPDWGRYTAHGRLRTRVAHAAARRRIERQRRDSRAHVIVDTTTDFLARLPEGHLDWAYLDTSHAYDETRGELAALRTRLKPGGLLVGDDWVEDPQAVHGGLATAVREAVAAGAFENLRTYAARQWSVQVPR